MASELEKRTVEVMTSLRIVLVGLSDAQTKLCKRTLAPIMMVPFKGAKEACGGMSSVLPLLVIASRALDASSLDELRDSATTCAAEVLVLDDPPEGGAAERLLEAVRRADARRVRAERRDD